MKLSEDSIKAVERAKLELAKLDQQLQVSLDEYSKVRELNHRLDSKMQLEKAVSGEAEQSLKVSQCDSICVSVRTRVCVYMIEPDVSTTESGKGGVKSKDIIYGMVYVVMSHVHE